jgi:hypothetical protein
MADGVRITDDFHFEHGDRHVIKLTKAQIKALEAARVDGKLPFTTKLKLTDAQQKTLEKSTKKRILEVEVFEGKYTCCGCCAQNIASRFKPDKLELSSSYMVDLVNLRNFDE